MLMFRAKHEREGLYLQPHDLVSCRGLHILLTLADLTSLIHLR